jgi:hypothetical protein
VRDITKIHKSVNFYDIEKLVGLIKLQSIIQNTYGPSSEADIATQIGFLDY